MIEDVRIENLGALPDHRSVIVIDLDTGTVLGTNLVACLSPATDEELDNILSSDSLAHDYGMEHGTPLFIVTHP